jgi:hypothetical protein
MTLAASEIAAFAGWVERLVCRSSTIERGSETHQRRPVQQLIDIASAFSLGTAVKSYGADPQIQIVRLISSSTRISDSIRTSRHVRFALHVQRGSLPRSG